MVTYQQLADRLYRRFKGVPNFEMTDATELVTDAMQTHGYEPSDTVSAKDVTRILLLSQSEGAWQVALSVAHYFKYTDGEEGVDKSEVSEQYRKLARDIRVDYEGELATDIIGTSKYKVMRRIDRP